MKKDRIYTHHTASIMSFDVIKILKVEIFRVKITKRMNQYRFVIADALVL